MADAVCLAYVHNLEVAYSWHNSVVHLLLFDAASEGRISEGGYVSIRCARSGDLPDARNTAVKAFLTKPADWLFFIDTDMGFRPDTVEELLAVADPAERPIVGALAFAQKETAEDGLSGYRTAPRPTVLDWTETPEGPKFMGLRSYPVNSVLKVAGTGSACILIHRSVFERMEKEYGQTWYNRVAGTDGSLLGEDTSFCVRAGSLDIPIHVHTGVKTSHLKNQWVQEADFMAAAMPPPATDEVAVIVPVMNRPQNAEPFMRSLRASTGLATVYAVAGRDDPETASAWRTAGADVLCTDDEQVDGTGTVAVSFAQRVNLGHRQTGEPWLFLVGDDVRFHPGWLDHAQHVAKTWGAKVVGVNDLGNPRTLAGEHAAHLLIARDYIDTVGASWDGPGVACHEGYRHWYVDDEVVTAAKQRGVWQMALGSIVEHMHPLFGKGEDDPVYALGQSFAQKDGELFRERLEKYR